MCHDLAPLSPQAEVWFASLLRSGQCLRVEARAGQTLVIPSAWCGW
jgi:hypothetical protein